MTKRERELMAARRARIHGKRHVEAIRDELGIAPWSHTEWERLLVRMGFIAGDGLTEPDLRVLVRLYNRECIGRRQSQGETT